MSMLKVSVIFIVRVVKMKYYIIKVKAINNFFIIYDTIVITIFTFTCLDTKKKPSGFLKVYPLEYLFSLWF